MVHHGNGDLVPVELGVLNDGVLGDGALQIVLEELFYLRGVGARPAQEGGGLKGAPTGAHGKVLGVQHDTGQQSLGLRPGEIGGVGDVLQ